MFTAPGQDPGVVENHLFQLSDRAVVAEPEVDGFRARPSGHGAAVRPNPHDVLRGSCNRRPGGQAAAVGVASLHEVEPVSAHLVAEPIIGLLVHAVVVGAEVVVRVGDFGAMVGTEFLEALLRGNMREEVQVRILLVIGSKWRCRSGRGVGHPLLWTWRSESPRWRRHGRRPWPRPGWQCRERRHRGPRRSHRRRVQRR